MERCVVVTAIIIVVVFDATAVGDACRLILAGCSQRSDPALDGGSGDAGKRGAATAGSIGRGLLVIADDSACRARHDPAAQRHLLRGFMRAVLGTLEPDQGQAPPDRIQWDRHVA